MLEYYRNFLIDIGIDFNTANYVVEVSLLILALVLALLSKIMVDKMFGATLKVVKSKKYKWHNILVKSKFFKRLSHLVPLIILYVASLFFPTCGPIMRIILNAYALLIAVFLLDAFLKALNDVYNSHPISKKRPIKGLIQITKIVIYCIAVVIIVAHLLGKNPTVLLGSIGAFTAILLLIFKDALLGFVSGIQIAANDMVRIGDWVEMPKYDANGEVVDISLTTIKVENFDNTITTVPAYAFISDSFKNWRRMQERGARRIKRSILIDINSIKFCSQELIEKLKKINYISDYLETMQREIKIFNKNINVKMDESYNGRHLTNIGVFRIYLENYLKNNEYIHKDMTRVVRQLDPIENGLPLEIYTFTTLTEWEDYERIQSDIFDHIIAIAKDFDLRIYQRPSSSDIRKLADNIKSE